MLRAEKLAPSVSSSVRPCPEMIVEGVNRMAREMNDAKRAAAAESEVGWCSLNNATLTLRSHS